MIHRALLVIAALLVANAAHAAGQPPLLLKGALMKSIDRAEADSGYIAFWDHWSVETQIGVSKDLFSLRMSKADVLPRPGERCDVRYHMGRLGGSLGPGLKTDADWPMVDSFTCAPTADQTAAPKP